MSLSHYVVRDLEDCKIGRANDARSSWLYIEDKWPDAVVSSINEPPVRGWMKFTLLIEESDIVVIMVPAGWSEVSPSTVKRSGTTLLIAKPDTPPRQLL